MKATRRSRRRLQYKINAGKAFLILLGVALACFGLKGFLLPNHFIDGGITGISLLTYQLTYESTGIPVSVWLVLFNTPFIILGARQIGKRFAIGTSIAIVVLAATIFFVDFPVITDDKLLTAIFGGFFLGAGIGLAIRGGCVIDGTEILAVYLNRKSILSMGDIILLINVVIFLLAAFVLGIENALYSILTYLSASKTVDFIIQGIEEYTGVTIVSAKSAQIREAITKNLGRGVTVYKGERGFESAQFKSKDIDIIFTVITRLEVSKLKQEIDQIDHKAFIVMSTISDTKGGIIKPRPLH
ncbi:MAG: YitT family protein [Daejeonella sp.]|uniref:YitT family protein n=1 Tax=Daejeonella sp. JGW-45 TaxID=3034148 RepID=UPI0023EB7183|nr:YitT family protein [Daejeonella sp. JGW-45]